MTVISSLVEHIGGAIRADGWENVVLGLGGTKDPSAYTTFGGRGRITDDVLESLYVEDHFAAKVIEALPKAGLRPGWDLALPGDPIKTTAIKDAYRAREDELGVAEELAQGACWGRLFGGALTWIGVDDGLAPEMPLNETRVESVRFLHTFDRRDIVVHAYYADPMHPKFRRPAVYEIRANLSTAARQMTGVSGSLGVLIHESRCVVWRGQSSTETRRIQLAGWDDSVLERCWEPLKQIGEDYGAKSLLLGRVSQAIYKIQNLYAMIAGKQEETLRRRMAMLDASRSRARAIVLDTTEDFINVTQSLGGVDTLIDKAILRLAAAADMPVTVLMGQSPAGFDATGESDLEQWSAQADMWRALELRPRHERITRLILLAKDGPTGGVEPDEWEMKYRPLRVPRPKELAELRMLEAQTDAVNIDKGIYPAEVAAFRYTALGASGVMLDQAEAREMLSRRRELANQPPKDNAELGTAAARATGQADLVARVVAGEIPRETGAAILVQTYRLEPADAEAMLGPIAFAARVAPESTPGPAPDAPNGSGAGAPQGLPGFNDGGAQ